MLGYFGIKIFFGAFKKYPNKYYQQNLEINKLNICSEECQDNKHDSDKVILDYFIPGIWNNEIYDLIITIILAGITYIFTEMTNRNLLNSFGFYNFAFIIGYLIGLNSPYFKAVLDKDPCDSTPYNKSVRITLTLFFYITVIIILILNVFGAIETENGLFKLASYVIYIVVIVIIIVGLIATRKKDELYKKFLYKTYTQQHTDDGKYIRSPTHKTTGKYKLSSDNVVLTMTFIAWLFTLFFVYEPTNNVLLYFYNFINGVVLGVFVSGMSFYGCEYLLSKSPKKNCSTSNDCKDLIEMPSITDEEATAFNFEQNIKNLKTNIDVLKYVVGGTAFILIVVMLFVYYKK